MNARKRAATVLVTVVAVIGLALPGTAAARSYSLPQQNASVVVTVDVVQADASISVVSWGD